MKHLTLHSTTSTILSATPHYLLHYSYDMPMYKASEHLEEEIHFLFVKYMYSIKQYKQEYLVSTVGLEPTTTKLITL
jgi:hypothetical protein